MSAEQLHWHPPGNANPIGAVCVHVVMDESVLVQHEIRCESTLADGDWAGRMGLSEPPIGGAAWAAWAPRVEIDLDAFGSYVRAVYEAPDGWASTVDEAALNREVEFGEGRSAVSHVLWRVISHNDGHAGEIAVLKGLQAIRGYSLWRDGDAASPRWSFPFGGSTRPPLSSVGALPPHPRSGAPCFAWRRRMLDLEPCFA